MALVAFGANIAIDGLSLSAAVAGAIDALNRADCQLQARSRLFVTPCFPQGAGPDYINAVASYKTILSPRDLLARMHDIEAEMGRQRVQRWGSRTMDLDLLDHGQAVLPDHATFRHWQALPPDQQATRAPDRLILPHPRLAERAFVLVPLLDVAPEWRHPVIGLSARQLAEALPMSDRLAVRPV